MESLEHILGLCGESHINIYWILFLIIISYIFLKIMARKVKVQVYKSKSRKRKGVHAKTKCSKVKHSKNYKKRYIGQGR